MLCRAHTQGMVLLTFSAGLFPSMNLTHDSPRRHGGRLINPFLVCLGARPLGDSRSYQTDNMLAIASSTIPYSRIGRLRWQYNLPARPRHAHQHIWKVRL